MGLSDQLNMPLALEKLDGPTQADPHPSQLPQPLLELLVYSNLDWISPSWTSTFNSIFSQQSPRVPCAPTHQASSDTSVSALKHQTIKCYLSGVRFYLITHSYANPFANDLPKLQYVLRGIKIQEGILRRLHTEATSASYPKNSAHNSQRAIPTCVSACGGHCSNGVDMEEVDSDEEEMDITCI